MIWYKPRNNIFSYEIRSVLTVIAGHHFQLSNLMYFFINSVYALLNLFYLIKNKNRLFFIFYCFSLLKTFLSTYVISELILNKLPYALRNINNYY